MIPFARKYKIELLLAIFVLTFIAYFSFISINRYLTFRSNYFDLGIMDQVVYNTSRGRILEMTNQDFHANASRFAIHFDPLLAFFAPLYLIYSDPSVLLVAQAMIIALGAIAVYLIGIKVTKNKLVSLLFAVSYLFYFPNQRAVMFDFHAVLFSTTFLLFTIYFSLVKKYRIMLLFILLSLLTKEHIGLITFLFGLYMFFIQKERRYSLAVMGISLFFFFMTFFYIIPHARQSSHFALQYLEDIGDSPGSILVNLIKNPMYILNKLSKSGEREYLFRIFVPHLPLILFAPLEFLIALPEIAINVLSKSSNMRAIYFHYNAAIVPFVYFSAITGYGRMRKYVNSNVIKGIILAVYTITTFYFIYMYDPLPIILLNEPYFYRAYTPNRINKLKVVEEWQKKLADETIPVATTPQIAPFFTNRQYFYNFLYDTGFEGAGFSENDIIREMNTYQKAEYIVIAKSEVQPEGRLPQKFYRKLQADNNYKSIFDSEYIVVYKRLHL